MKRTLVISLIAICGAANAQITNGGFETGDLTGWTVYATTPSPTVNGTLVHSGNFSALLGTDSGTTEPNGDGAMYQQFTVPNAGGTLSFWTNKSTTDSITFDWQDAYILNSSGTNLLTIFHTCTTQGWTQWTQDMSSFAGQTVRIAFLVHQDGFGDLTSMRVDDVNFAPVPEPATMSVLGIGALALIRRRRAKKA